MEEHIILMLTSVIIVYHVIQLLYHTCFRVVYLSRVRKLMLAVNITSVVFVAAILMEQKGGCSDYDGILVLFFLLFLMILNTLILKHNWEKYTVASFVKNGIYEFEVQGLNRGFVFGRIYWDRKNYPNLYCTGWLYADYFGRSFAEMRAEYIKNTKMKVGDICKVRFMKDTCFPYFSVEPNRGNIVKLI